MGDASLGARRGVAARLNSSAAPTDRRSKRTAMFCIRSVMIAIPIALHYRMSDKPYDVHSFGDERPMTGQAEDHVTYPQFVGASDGTLYFFYRDGASGNGTLCLNRYDSAGGKWQAVHHPLVDGENQ